MDIRRWLEDLGLGRYHRAFCENDIDAAILPELTADDLTALGVTSIGHRRKLLAAAGDLRENPKHATEKTAVITASAPKEDRSDLASVSAERRQLTVMFCDLVDSVGLSRRLDPEDLRDVIVDYQRTCSKPIQRYDGYIANYVGDGLLILFGYPAAHEDDAERAVRAGLEIVDAISKLNQEVDHIPDLDLRVRVGIATGVVVVGDVVSEGVSDKDAVAGEAANLAARLQGIAGPNCVIISPVTRQLAGERFEYLDLGTQELKGYPRPVGTHQVIGERAVSRLESRSAALTPFVGRNKEIAILLKCWEHAISGNGQVVIISGEAGIGKSRIAAELSARIRHADQAWDDELPPLLIFQFSPYHANTPLYPIKRELERLAGIGRLDTQRQRFDKLGTILGGDDPDNSQTISLVGDLFGLDLDERYLLPTATPAVKRHLTIEALRAWCASRSQYRPLMIVFEDIQWIDPTSKLFLSRLLDWVKDASVLITITVRTDGDSSTETFLNEIGLLTEDSRHPSHVTICEIQELPEVEAKQLATAAAGKEISQTQYDEVLTKSEGIPLYIEEMVKAVVSRIDGLPSPEGVDRAEAVPNTINDALMAQLDQLGRAKELAQHASVIGQEFPSDLLAKITMRSPDKLVLELHRLIESRIVVESAAASEMYRFRHAMIRDVSYWSLLRKARRQIHLRIAGELAERTTESLDPTDDLIAQHYSLGGVHLDAIRYWQKGAMKAIARSAHEEALGMLQAALADFRKLRDSKSLVSELDLVLAQAMALRSLRGYGSPEVEERLNKARELCAISGDTAVRFNVEWGLFQCTIVKGDIIGARQLADGLFGHAERHPNRPFVDAYLANGMVAALFGEFERATGFLEKGAELSNPETDEPHFFTHGQNAGLFCLSYLARNLCFLGYLDRGRATINSVLSIAATRAGDPGHLYGYVNALIHAVRVYHLCGDLDAEQRLADESLNISRRNHYAYYEALSTCHLGWVAGARGFLLEGIDKMVDGLAALERTATLLAMPGFYLLLSKLYIRAGQLDEASQALQKAVELRGSGFRVWDADIERVRGDIFLSRVGPDFEGAEHAYRSSLAIAQHQRAGLLIFKAGLSLARLLQRLDRRREGYEVLKRCFEQLHEGYDTEEVRNAQKAMNDLARTD